MEMKCWACPSPGVVRATFRPLLKLVRMGDGNTASLLDTRKRAASQYLAGGLPYSSEPTSLRS